MRCYAATSKADQPLTSIGIMRPTQELAEAEVTAGRYQTVEAHDIEEPWAEELREAWRKEGLVWSEPAAPEPSDLWDAPDENDSPPSVDEGNPVG